jgi:TM2 domain-containing membrane protein YozV
MAGQSVKCPSCGMLFAIPLPGGFEPVSAPPGPGHAPVAERYPGADKKLAAGLCGIFLGAFGVHKFILGFTTPALIMLLTSITCVGYPIMYTIGLIEGIIYLAKSDADFYREYIVEQKAWF